MIVIGNDCPGWIRELSRFLPLKNLLFVYGNILDLISYPVRRPNSEEIYWTESDLPLFFERFLSGLQYEIIGFVDPVDGLTFPSSSTQMQDIYKRLQKGKEVQVHPNPPAEQQKQQSGTGTIPNAESAERQETSIPKKGGASDLLPTINGIRAALMNKSVPCAFVFNLSSRLVISPKHLVKAERDMFTILLKASLDAREVIKGNLRWSNLLVLICDKLNDMPPFLYLNNPRSRSIYIPTPDTTDRMRFINRSFKAFHKEPDKSPPELTKEIISTFAALTEGLTNYEMKSLVSLSLREQLPVRDTRDIQNLCERYKYGITESEWDKINKSMLDNAESEIRKSIKGQDAAVAAVLDTLKRAKIGLTAGTSHKSSRPRGVLFFAGPTGVGKTEMAKTLAKLLFGQEDRCIRFDMSEYSSQHADQRLLGSPPGYVGYDEGGQLTKAVKENPFSILLFDEIEKAHGSIFDKFLQILDDGRLTDGKGETVYFSECIIIFTSNLGTDKISNLSPEPYPKIKDTVLNAIKDHFNTSLGRPEILNRFGDSFVVFDFIRPPLDKEIVDLLLSKVVTAAKESKKLELFIEVPVREKIISLAKLNLHHGGRGIRNAIDSALINPLNRILFDKGIEKEAKVRLHKLIDHGEDAPARFELKIAVEKLNGT